MKDNTKGYNNGDKCPNCSNGSIEIRETVKAGNHERLKYAQCSRCSWNSLR